MPIAWKMSSKVSSQIFKMTKEKYRKIRKISIKIHFQNAIAFNITLLGDKFCIENLLKTADFADLPGDEHFLCNFICEKNLFISHFSLCLHFIIGRNILYSVQPERATKKTWSFSVFGQPQYVMNRAFTFFLQLSRYMAKNIIFWFFFCSNGIVVVAAPLSFSVSVKFLYKFYRI